MNNQREKQIAKVSSTQGASAAQPLKPPISVVPVVAVVISGFALTGAIFLWLVKNAGHAYREGYLNRFGFQPDALPWSADDLTMLGYYVQADILVVFLAIVTAGTLLIGGVFYASNLVNDRRARRFHNQNAKSSLDAKPRLVTGEVMFAWVAAIVLFVLILCCAVPIGLLEPVRERGIKDADTVMEAIRNRDVATLKLHNTNFVEINRDKVGTSAGVVISCTEKFCALYSPLGTVHAHTVPLTDILSWTKIDWDMIPDSEWKKHP